jgi:hypothetical protein
MSPKVEQLVPKVERESAAPPKPPATYWPTQQEFNAKLGGGR